eukprot:Plantae.Rhodophyta-Purpureofilum_apyrenoidigerum.ctg20673.p1 GENE.Plantae.Rhodophyta-Purpureofilum_apyrenoidigerum.ctg20673~~Plantae.Rhodophyta-Purpureofilum_apyrenoidigerum.ctg20673.p1  ORF type:complete len:240 (-),score=38.81 Plantae.Rhodophyta-Purpureofilum_apyrenoidigerum.ctg20673:319-1038(-)
MAASAAAVSLPPVEDGRISLASEESVQSVEMRPVQADVGEGNRIARILSSWMIVDDLDGLDKAVYSVLEVFDALLGGSGPAHGIIVSDIRCNLQKIRRGAESVGATSAEDMALREVAKSVLYRDSGREALLWLKRTLQFIRKTVLFAVDDPHDENLGRAIKSAYNETLAPCHGLRAHAFRLFMNGAPTKSEFFRRMEATSDVAVLALHKWLDLSRPVITSFSDVCNNLAIENQRKCQIV